MVYLDPKANKKINDRSTLPLPASDMENPFGLWTQFNHRIVLFDRVRTSKNNAS